MEKEKMRMKKSQKMKKMEKKKSIKKILENKVDCMKKKIIVEN